MSLGRAPPGNPWAAARNYFALAPFRGSIGTSNDKNVRSYYMTGMATRLKAPIDPDDELATLLEHAALHDDGAAARSHLEAGFPIYYSEPDTPPDALIKEYPDGHRELVSMDHGGEHLIQMIA